MIIIISRVMAIIEVMYIATTMHYMAGMRYSMP